jgi:hypothetical protein
LEVSLEGSEDRGAGATRVSDLWGCASDLLGVRLEGSEDRGVGGT